MKRRGVPHSVDGRALSADSTAKTTGPKGADVKLHMNRDQAAAAMAIISDAADQQTSTPPTHARRTEGTSMTNLEQSNARVAATPRVRALANREGVALAAVVGTGAGGRITERDVRAASSQQPRALRALGSAGPVGFQMTVASAFAPTRNVTINPYAVNPLADDLRQLYPAQYAAAAAGPTPIPTLFPTGSLPVFTAADVDPGALSALPWQARHVVARANRNDAVAIINDFTPGPSTDLTERALFAAMCFGNDQENMAYRARLLAWLRAYDYNAQSGKYELGGGSVSYPAPRGRGV